MTDDKTPAARVDHIVATVDGVRETYAAAPLAARAVRQLVDRNDALSVVRDDGGRATVSIAVSALDDSADIAARVAEAVRRELPAVGAAITVRVSRLVIPPSTPEL
jgi:hypothetical protein